MIHHIFEQRWKDFSHERPSQLRTQPVVVAYIMTAIWSFMCGFSESFSLTSKTFPISLSYKLLVNKLYPRVVPLEIRQPCIIGNKQYQVLLNSFHLKIHTQGFHSMYTQG